MRLREFENQTNWSGWININTNQRVAIDGSDSHAYSVASKPEMYGLTKADIPHDLTKYKSEQAADFDLDGDPKILNMMSNLGWVRIILSDHKLHIEAQKPEEVRKVAKLIHKGTYYNMLYFDINGDYRNEVRIVGEDAIKKFIKYGKV